MNILEEISPVELGISFPNRRQATDVNGTLDQNSYHGNVQNDNLK